LRQKIITKLLILSAGIGLTAYGMYGIFCNAAISDIPVIKSWHPSSDFYENRTKCEEVYYEVIPEDMALLAAYQEYNPDVIGIIRIPDTVLNHPIVQTPAEEEYYLNRDLAGNYNSHGVPFLSADSSWGRTGSNIIIYGHNIHLHSRDVFCDLSCYEELEYYKEHPIIETVSEAGTGRWLIFAYFLVDNADTDPFQYSETTNFLSRQAFTEYMKEVSKRNWLSVDADICFGDTLLTLSSCSVELSGSGTNRMVVMAKLLENGESCETKVEHAEMSESPLLPEKLR
ncbi:MAG: class B sortase, partial [Lachnospiraceae bacterium]